MEITAHFKLIFLSVLSITVLCLIGLAVLAIFGSDALKQEDIPVLQSNVNAACTFGWQSGIGAILGLLGGKVTANE